ncbi:acrylyl-CoA reductase family protein [Devosia nitrariae]|uniref:acrylyl-CoA reductase family protein n=1 Tax=Devosia nitrariae TaxID=2071872 RepID=UPI00406BCB0D
MPRRPRRARAHLSACGGHRFSGTVRESSDDRHRPGDKVILTGWRVGETHWGGYAERARVKADWLVPLPAGATTRWAMVLGTAGLTAMLAVNRLEAAGIRPDSGAVLVTGAAGGVGSIALGLLSRLGYKATALSGRPEHRAVLEGRGAGEVIARDAFLNEPDKSLESARWAGAIDSVGGAVLGKLLRQVNYGGAVAALGNAAGMEFNTSVLPFILRGVSLLGVESVMQPFAARVEAWGRLVELFDAESYEALIEEMSLEDLPKAAEEILAGQILGRRIVRVSEGW